MKSRIAWLLVLLPFCGTDAAAQSLPIQAWGDLPSVSLLAVSPSGERIAVRRTGGDVDVALVVNRMTGDQLGAVDVSDVKPRRMFFSTEDHLILFASDTKRLSAFDNAWEASAAFVYDLTRNDVTRLLGRFDELYPTQSGLGRIVGQSADGERLYMPGYLGDRLTASHAITYGLMEYNLANHRTRRIKRGTPDTVDWFVDRDGQPVAEEEINQNSNTHRLYSWVSGERELIYEEETSIPVYSFVGLSQDSRYIYFFSYREGDANDYGSYYTMDLENGDIAGPVFERDNVGADYTMLDAHRVVHGVAYAGFRPSYRFVDERVDALVRTMQRSSNGGAAHVVGWTPGFGQVLFQISGAWTAGTWFLAASDGSPPVRLGAARPDIDQGHVVPTRISSYTARDGLEIPALVTVRDDVREAGDAPLIVLPHGGPAARDRFGFDWLAQYLASKGYAVLQPQYRGSSGFGASFELAGRGEWGGKMSTDLDDGVLHLVETGLADAARVCMVGGSYGGYAALAAAAFSDVGYRCVVSINGVSDLSKMLQDAKQRRGSDHWAIDYWTEQFGASDSEKALLRAISPVHHADSFSAPVLLLHGRDDTVVSRDQSQNMNRALRRAKKPVEFVTLKGEDHYLSEGTTRLEALRAIDSFLDEHL